MSGRPFLSAHNIIKQFGRRKSLDGVSLDVPEGALLVLFGPNGAGKSTLMRILATLSRPTSGSLMLKDVDVLEEPERVRQMIGMVSHAPLLYQDLTAQENLQFFASLYGLNNAQIRIKELLDMVELSHRAHDAVRTFSRGMTQRLSIARALVHDPELVLLDEPYSGLDPHAAAIFDELIATMRKDRTLVMVSHDLAKGLELASHLAILCDGKLVFFDEASATDRSRFTALYHRVVGQVTGEVIL